MFTFRKNGEVLSRVNKDGGLKKVDLKRRRIAESLHAVYVGVMEYVSPNSNKEVPSTQNKPVIKLPNGTMLAMTSNAFYNKLSVTNGEKKTQFLWRVFSYGNVTF